MHFHVLLSVCAIMLGMAVHGIDWKYDISGREGLFVGQVELSAVMADSHDARPSVAVESVQMATGSNLFDVRSRLVVEKCDFALTFEPIPLWIILR